MRLTGVHSHGNGIRCNNRECGCAPETVEGVSRCRCKGYPATTLQGDCTVCGAPLYDYEYMFRADVEAARNSGGFVETTETEDIFPVTIYVYLNTHGTKQGEHVRITNMKESSLTMEEKKGVRTLVCESFTTGRIAYIPYAVWYATELQTTVYGNED